MIRNMLHIGINVADLQRSIAFYRDQFGMELTLHKRFEGEQYSRLQGLARAAGTLAILKAANLQIELFEFEEPKMLSRDRDRPFNDEGITHFCISVDDIEGTYERLKAAGVRFNSPPLLFFNTKKAVFGRDPDGNLFEMVEVVTPSEKESDRSRIERERS